jgi:hypothetical protein
VINSLVVGDFGEPVSRAVLKYRNNKCKGAN